MNDAPLSPESLRALLRDALADALVAQRDLLREVVADALEDVALAEAIREGQQTEPVSRAEVFAHLGGPP